MFFKNIVSYAKKNKIKITVQGALTGIGLQQGQCLRMELYLFRHVTPECFNLFKITKIGTVGDCLEVLPELIKSLEKMKKSNVKIGTD
ncbi:hypothetical protein CLOSBL3_11495 [Clostridiaceae bacterium BL-3]|nr:hypothetical protein CLOSBL3_11495 [Clostridiaceae bacterium BL-3]